MIPSNFDPRVRDSASSINESSESQPRPPARTSSNHPSHQTLLLDRAPYRPGIDTVAHQPPSMRAGAIAPQEPGQPRPSFTGLWVPYFSEVRPALYEPTWAAPAARTLPSATSQAVRLRDPRTLTLRLQSGIERQISVPELRGPQSAALGFILNQGSIGAAREQLAPDGSRAVAFIVTAHDQRQWLVALQVASNGTAERAQVMSAQGRGPHIQPVNIKFKSNTGPESLTTALLQQVVNNLRTSRDLGALSATSYTLARVSAERAQVMAAFDAITSKIDNLDDMHCVVTNLARDARICDLSVMYEVRNAVTHTRMTESEKGRLLEMLATRIATLRTMIEGEALEKEAQPALARLMLLHANNCLPPDSRGNLSALESGKLFGNARGAIQAGVPIPTAAETFPEEGIDVNDEELQNLAVSGANVLIRTGSAWEDARITQGIGHEHFECANLKQTSVASIVTATARGLNSLDEVHKLANAYQIFDEESLSEIASSWEYWKGHPTTAELREGMRATQVYQHYAQELDEDEDEDSADVTHEDIPELECFQVMRFGPALLKAKCTGEDIIEALQIAHPLSCHLARRMAAGSVVAWLDPEREGHLQMNEA